MGELGPMLVGNGWCGVATNLWRTAGIMKSSRDHWIRMDRDYLNRIEMRKALLRDHDETIIGVNSIVAPAIEELYEEIMLDYLPQRYPSMFQRRKGGKIENLVTGATYPDSLAGAGDPATMLRLMGQHVEEDFYIMCPDEAEEYRLQGYVACFPGGFLALARVGMSMRDIHKPVPGFEERIGKSVDRYFRRMEPGNFIGRMNVSKSANLSAFDFWGIYPFGERIENLEEEAHPTKLTFSLIYIFHMDWPLNTLLLFTVQSWKADLQLISGASNVTDQTCFELMGITSIRILEPRNQPSKTLTSMLHTSVSSTKP